MSLQESKDIVFGRLLDNSRGFDEDQLLRLYVEGTRAFMGLGVIKNGKIKPQRLVNTSELAKISAIILATRVTENMLGHPGFLIAYYIGD